MAGSSDSLADILSRPITTGPSEQPRPDDPDALTIADMNGGQTMRPANRNLMRLHIIDRHGKVRTMQYAFLDVESRFDGDHFTLIFAGTRHWQVTVKGHGKKFWAVYDYCTLHRWPYLREATGSMPGAGGDETGAVFTEIDVKDVTPDHSTR